MDAKELLKAIGDISETKGITNEAVVNALKESLIRAYTKYLGGGDDADVRCEIDPVKGSIELGQMKKVVDEVTDDYIQIDIKEANAGLKKAKYKDGDDYFVSASIEDLKKATAMAVKSNFRQKLGEAERAALYEIYKDHIGEMITGIVEKTDDRSVTVNIGRTNVELSRREMIGDESFKLGEPIKVYIEEVRSAKLPEGVSERVRGPQIQVTRSSEGFLKRLFEEEIHEIYEGTVLIKGIARQAGVRSKIAVYSNNDDVDPTGACIGTSGSRIQRIVSQLGNGKDKEKIDIIGYSENKGVFICEALRPAQVVGVKLFDIVEGEKQKAIAVIKDHTMSLAIGRKMANLKLACVITGMDIQLIEEAQAAAEAIEFVPVEELMKQAEAEKAVRAKEAYFVKSKEQAAKRAEELEAIKNAEAPKTGATAEEFPEEAANPALAGLEVLKAEEAERRAIKARAEERKAFSIPVAEETKPAANEEVVEETVEPVEEKPTEVKTTTTLDALEKELESSGEKKPTTNKSNKRPRKITEEEVSHVTSTETITTKAATEAMAIYTDEELEAMENEDAELDEDYEDGEEVDYEDYDQYYDEK